MLSRRSQAGLMALAVMGAAAVLNGAGEVVDSWRAPPEIEVRVLEIAARHREMALVTPSPAWAPTMCAAPPPAALMSGSKDEHTHGGKLYVLYARDGDAYRKLGDKDAAPVAAGQAIVKETWLAAPAVEGGRKDHDPAAPQGTVQGKGGAMYEAGERGPLFVMLKTDAHEAWADDGWVYATLTPDGKTVTSAGRIASCVECHSAAPHGRLFGLQP